MNTIKLTNRTYVKEDTIKNIIEDYNSGISLEGIGKKYNVPERARNIIFKNYNINKRTSGESRIKRIPREKIINGLKTTINCQICKKEFKSLISHIKLHDISLEFYKNTYGEVLSEYTLFLMKKKKSESTKNKYSEIMKKRWVRGDFDSKEIRDKYRTFLGKHHTAAHCKYMSNLYQGREIVWKDKIVKNWKTEDRKTKHKNFLEKYKKENGYYPCQSPQSVEKRINSQMLRFLNNDPWWTNSKRGYYFSTKTKREEYYQSSYEKNKMIELDNDDDVLDWTKKHYIIIKYRTTYNYFPDFLIILKNGKKILEEIKGYIDDDQRFIDKSTAALEYCQKNNIEYKITFPNERNFNNHKHLLKIIYGDNKN